MGFLNKYPYLDEHELNLDWLLGKMRELDIKVTDWMAFTEIKFADPILWDINTAYAASTIVLDSSGNSYISKKPVPGNGFVDIHNTDYWQLIGDFSAQFAQVLQELNKRIIHIDDVATLIADTDLKVDDVVYVLGYHAANDGGEALFKIVDTAPATAFYHTLTNGLFAELVDDGQIVLPRYGGTYVNEMVDNARPYITWYQLKNVILPEPNKNHPGCGSYTLTVGLETKEVYYWLVDAPIVFDEHFSYTNVYLNGEISANAVMEAVLKISDANKPEDITFIGQTKLSGFHYNGIQHLVDHALLIEGCARVKFDNLLASFAKNSVTLGGDNALNPIEFQTDYLEVGSCSEKGFNVKNANVTIFSIANMRVQNYLNDSCTGIYLNGLIAYSNIGDLLITGGTYAGTSKMIDATSTVSNIDNVLRIDTARMSGQDISFDRGCYTFGSLSISFSISSTNTIDIADYTYLICSYISTQGVAWNVQTTNNSKFIATSAHPRPTALGRNVIIGSFSVDNVVPAILEDGLAFYPSANLLNIIASGNIALSGNIFKTVKVDIGTLDNSTVTSQFVDADYANYRLVGVCLNNNIDVIKVDGIDSIRWIRSSGTLEIVRQNPAYYANNTVTVILADY